MLRCRIPGMCKEEKRELRRKWREIRNGISHRAEKSRQICEKVCKHSAIAEANTVFVYLSFGSEVETMELVKQLLAMGKRVGVPKCDTKHRTMAAAEITELTGLIPNSYGILEPTKDAPILSKGEIDAVLVPALAFDEDGFRLGYGGGYYDKYLADYSGVTLGIAFADCVTNRLPRGEFDRPVDEVLTEE